MRAVPGSLFHSGSGSLGSSGAEEAEVLGPQSLKLRPSPAHSRRSWSWCCRADAKEHECVSGHKAAHGAGRGGSRLRGNLPGFHVGLFTLRAGPSTEQRAQLRFLALLRGWRSSEGGEASSAAGRGPAAGAAGSVSVVKPGSGPSELRAGLAAWSVLSACRSDLGKER